MLEKQIDFSNYQTYIYLQVSTYLWRIIICIIIMVVHRICININPLRTILSTLGIQRVGIIILIIAVRLNFRSL